MKRRMEPMQGAGAGPMFNQILNGRFGDVLTRMLWIRSAGAPAPTLAPEIGPSFDVNQQDDPAMMYLRAERLQAGFGIRAAPGAGNWAKVALNNPTGSGLMAVIERVEVWTDILGDFYYNLFQSTTAGTLALQSARDSRFSNLQGGMTIVTVAEAIDPAPGTVGFLKRDVITAALGNSTKLWENPGIVVVPGSRFAVAHAVGVTPTLLVNFQWRERALTAEESRTG